MGRGRFSGCVVVTLLAAALSGAPTFAGDFEHRLLVAGDAKVLATALNQAGSSGYRLSALVDRADDLAAIVTHAAGNERFEYAVLAADNLDAVSDLGKRGYTWRASATALGWATPAIVLERPSKGLAAHELRVVVAGDVAALEGQLADPFAQGFHVVGRQRVEQKKVWVVLERTPGAPAREVRVISADGPRSSKAPSPAPPPRGSRSRPSGRIPPACSGTILWRRSSRDRRARRRPRRTARSKKSRGR